MSRSPIHVMAALLTDAKGRVLLARRLLGRDFAGFWEFPGGKVDPGETPESALARELMEELGIEARIDEPLMVVPQHLPKALKLDVRWVRHWNGTPKGLDGQALAWVPREKLPQYAVPPPDVPVIASVLEPDVLWITPAFVDEQMWLSRLAAVLESGVRRVQLRPFPTPLSTSGDGLLATAVNLCKQYHAEVCINGNPALAYALRCGLHLKSHQLMRTEMSGDRILLDGESIPTTVQLSASCHNAEELVRAHALNCRYAVLGPVAQTASHPNTAPLGWASFFEIRGHAPALPTYALGGMTPAHVLLARSYGAQGIATITGL